jgi:hypothetical protein
MRSARSLLVVVVLAVGFTWGTLRLLGRQFAAGDFYPAYSSLRSDPKGAKLLFDTLSRLPGFSVIRNYLPLEYFTGKSAVLLLGLSPAAFDMDFLKRAERLAQNGSRVVAAMEFRGEAPREDNHEKSPLEQTWHVGLKFDSKANDAHRLSLAPGAEWTVREQIGSRILAIERTFGAGSVLLLAESDDFGNESTLAGDRLDRVSAAIGDYTRVAFDEQHFGIAESGSVVQLARKFRLLGLALGLVIVGALAIWKNASPFPPPLAAGPGQNVGRTSFEGLLALLRRHVRARDLVRTCWEEWLKANRRELSPDRASRAAAVAAKASLHPLEAMREIEAQLPAGRTKGDL